MHTTAWKLVNDFTTETVPTWDISMRKTAQGVLFRTLVIFLPLPIFLWNVFHKAIRAVSIKSLIPEQVWKMIVMPLLFLQNAILGCSLWWVALVKASAGLTVSVSSFGATIALQELLHRKSTSSPLTKSRKCAMQTLLLVLLWSCCLTALLTFEFRLSSA